MTRPDSEPVPIDIPDKTSPLVTSFSSSSGAVPAMAAARGAGVAREGRGRGPPPGCFANGRRPEPDEPLEWYWTPIKGHPPFQELGRVR